jgi:hypothetical protein
MDKWPIILKAITNLWVPFIPFQGSSCLAEKLLDMQEDTNGWSQFITQTTDSSF